MHICNLEMHRHEGPLCVIKDDASRKKTDLSPQYFFC